MGTASRTGGSASLCPPSPAGSAGWAAGETAQRKEMIIKMMLLAPSGAVRISDRTSWKVAAWRPQVR